MEPQEETIPTSAAAVRMKIIINAVVVVLFGVLVTILFKTALGFGTRIESLVLWLLWICLPILWGIWSWSLLLAQRKTTYKLAQDSIVARRKGLFGITEQYYRYDTVLAVEARQDLLTGGQYGSIVLKVHRLQLPAKLENIERPDEYARRIKQLVAAGGARR